MAKNPFLSPVDEEDYLEFMDTEVCFVISTAVWKAVLPAVRSASTILDIGCGVGTLLHGIMEECKPGTRVIGLTKNKQHCEYAGVFAKGADVINADALHTPFRDRSIPLIFSTMLIEHVDDRACLREIRRILEDGGTLVLSTVLKRRWAYYFYRDERGGCMLAPDHVKEYTAVGELTGLMSEHGLVVSQSHVTAIRFSPVEFLLRSLYRITGSRCVKKVSRTRFMAVVRRLTRIPVPGFFAMELIARKR